MLHNLVTLLFAAMLGIWLPACAASDEGVNSSADSEVGQGAGGDDDEGDLDVSEPVPMWLVSEDDTLSKHEQNLNDSGGNGDLSQAKDSGLNPMNTARIIDPTAEEKKQVLTCSDEDKATYNEYTTSAQAAAGDTAILPVNFGISTSLITLPGLAAGELLTMVNLQAQLMGMLGDIFTERTFNANNSVTQIDLGADIAVGGFRYVEVVVVVPADKKRNIPGLYKINYYLREAIDSYALTTSIEFAPLRDDPQYANIRLFYSYKMAAKEYSDNLILSYNTKSTTVEATIGTSPARTDTPAETHLELVLLENLYAIFGASRYTNELVPSTSSFAAPRHYAPTNGDTMYFRALQDLSGTKKSVQDMSFVAAETTPATGNDLWAEENAGYKNNVLDYMVALFRGTSNGDCATSIDKIRDDGFTANNITIPDDLAAAPADICATNTAVSDETVKNWLLTICSHISLNMCFNIEVEGEQQSAYVGICRKVAEGLLMQNNHQRIEVLEIGGGRNGRFLDFGYATDPVLVTTLLAEPEANEDYSTLESYLDTMTFPAFPLLGETHWMDAPVRAGDYFDRTINGSKLNVTPVYLTGG